MKQVLLGILLSLCVTLSGKASSISPDQNYLQLLNNYYQQDKEQLIAQNIVDVAQAVVNNRNQYSQNTVATAFSLLSDVAFNRGNLLAAFQFAQYGNEVNPKAVNIKLDLLLKISRGYYGQGEYTQLRDTAQKAAWMAEQANDMNYHLQALAYSVVAYALSADYALATTELNKVEHLLSQNQQDVDQVTILEIIAEAHFYLAEYDNAVELLNRVLKLRKDLLRTTGIARTYHLVANAYYQLQQYDDAYNTYWQSLEFANFYELNIRAAYAELGLGQVLYQQQQFDLAKKRLLNAHMVFTQYDLLRIKLSTQISLIKVMYELGQVLEAENMLLSAQTLAETLALSPQQIELFLILTDYYRKQKQFELAIIAQTRYLRLYQEFHPNISVKNSMAATAVTAVNKAKKLALNLAEKSQLNIEFNDKYHRQQMLISILAFALGAIVLYVIYWRFLMHHQRLNRGYDELELPKNNVAQPSQTKRWYKQQYKMARKYQYNIAVAYLAVENWQELSFHFNPKTLTDVSTALAVIINENMDEEDYAGVISAGEYLFLCPHQTPEQALVKFNSIKKAIKTRFFANLGKYSVKINFSVDSPSIQDIDPYVFLSRLSERTEIE